MENTKLNCDMMPMIKLFFDLFVLLCFRMQSSKHLNNVNIKKHWKKHVAANFLVVGKKTKFLCVPNTLTMHIVTRVS